MAITDKNNSLRMYLVAGIMFMMAVFVVIKLTNIQWIEGEYYRELTSSLPKDCVIITSSCGKFRFIAVSPSFFYKSCLTSA